ncbi:Ig-like domain-containing protein [Microbacterium sp. X-17]|uniref:Ig-like domain-containing protein n=1 Tax=Microbacterium sp. X-17 TaxID=3144404 RepID=UPI0031F4D1AC
MSPPVRPRGATGLVVAVLSGFVVGALAFAVGSIAGLAPPASAQTGSASSASRSIPTRTAPAEVTGSSLADATAPADNSAPADTPTPTPTPGPPTLDPLPSGLVTTFPLTVSGTADPGDVIDVSGGSSASAAGACTVTAAADGTFRCALQRLPDGPGVPVRAVSRSSGLASSGRVDVLSPPTIVSAPGGTSGGGVRGTAYPGASVTVTAETGASCTFPADSAGNWGCVLPGLGDGRHTVTATQVAPFSSTRSARSPAVGVVVDTVAPPAPTISSPAPGTSVAAGGTIGFGGAGESGATVSVYASTSAGTTVACTATVAGGAWSCAATLPAGDYLASALQRDAAGNVSAGSNPVAVTVEAAGGATTPPPNRTSPAPNPAPAPAVPPTTTAPPSAPAAPTHPNTKGWTSTPFTTASAPVVTASSLPGWLRSVGLAVAALLLLVLPARLLVVSLARPREQGAERASIFGRNRAAAELGEADALLGGRAAVPGGGAHAAPDGAAAEGRQPVWLAPVVGVAAATLVTLSTSVHDASAYVRLLVAVSLAIVGVNAIWVLSARGMTRHLGVAVARTVVRPGLLVIVAAAAIGSRLLGLEPALLFGLVLGAVLPEGLGRVERGRTAAVQLSAVAAFGVLAWLTVGVLPTPSGAVSAFLVELVNAVALVAIGSTALALLPFGRLAGRAVLRWSRPLWLAMALVVYTVLFALLLPVSSLAETGAGVVAVVVIAVVFAAVALSVWLWERYVEPVR